MCYIVVFVVSLGFVGLSLLLLLFLLLFPRSYHNRVNICTHIDIPMHFAIFLALHGCSFLFFFHFFPQNNDF